MKTALQDGEQVVAGPDAPRRATCPACREAVHLARARSGSWFYYHVDNPDGDCPLRYQSKGTRFPTSAAVPSPEYALALRILRQTFLDALNGGGASQLDWLFDDVAQLTIQTLLQADASAALAATRQLVQRLGEEIAAGRGARLRRLLVYRDLQGLEGWFCNLNAGGRSER